MIQRGTVCVIRRAWIDGVCEDLIMPLAADRQWTYPEWQGCFSYLGDL